MTDLHALRRAQILAAEEAVIASIPKDLKKLMDRTQAEHEAKGGCPGCKSMVFAVHSVDCSELRGDCY